MILMPYMYCANAPLAIDATAYNICGAAGSERATNAEFKPLDEKP
jgi:hypothetical protein